jgi:hypothetical protein
MSTAHAGQFNPEVRMMFNWTMDRRKPEVTEDKLAHLIQAGCVLN